LVPVGAVSFMLFSKCSRIEVIIFGLIRFLLKKIAKSKLKKPKQVQTGWFWFDSVRFGFFKILIGFFTVQFFRLFFFSGFLGFLVFLLTPTLEQYLAWTLFFSVCFELLDVLCIGNFIDQG
jgi:hypothetical protein